jgi:hypothetical protein
VPWRTGALLSDYGLLWVSILKACGQEVVGMMRWGAINNLWGSGREESFNPMDLHLRFYTERYLIQLFYALAILCRFLVFHSVEERSAMKRKKVDH